ncbi:lipid A deacylase LpxR family protein [Algoriphagus sp. AGSA1]|uniref:lipid A-modifier LpxR family protein n=1 Tax=Algoriphagus sp. AGSA1 TaxID=2907213 RepID=UPI001F35989F|nr:lipid A-modifier LpxR family protein [Algoriphagus sp. AGSA1]MCE7054238.1 lipid A deacylase LpxR family protein [Algoriphagus sp. AGSA1]
MKTSDLLSLAWMFSICLPGLSVNEVMAQKNTLTKQVGFKHDNDVFRLKHITDKFYSFGLIINYTTALRDDNFLKKASENLGFNETDKVVFDNMVYLKGYTPEYDTDLSTGTFRPFAGVLNWEPSLYISNDKRLWRFGTVLGVRGKISGAEWVQDSFHDLISDPKFDGWRYQLPNKFLYGINGSFIKPLPFLNWMDFFSESNLVLGNYQTFLEENIGLRIGRFNSLNNSVMYFGNLDQLKRNKNEYFLVVKFFGRAIVTDTTLARDGNKQNVLNPLDKRNLQAGYYAAFHIQAGRFGANVSHTRNSTESNVSGKHSYGSLGVNYSFH